MNREELVALRERVAALTGPVSGYAESVIAVLGNDAVAKITVDWWIANLDNILLAVRGDLNAAERFRQAVLPDAIITIDSVSKTQWFVAVGRHHARHPSEPIARVLAVLSALIAKQEPAHVG